MNNTEVEALLQYKKVLQRLILTKDGVIDVKKHKKQIELIDDLLFYDRYTKGER